MAPNKSVEAGMPRDLGKAASWMTKTPPCVGRYKPNSSHALPRAGNALRDYGLAFPMKAFVASLIALLVVASTGCMGDQTRLMAESCQNMLYHDDLAGAKSFIRDAEEQVAALNGPQNKFTRLVRSLQDPQAMTFKPALEQCLWMLKSRQS